MLHGGVMRGREHETDPGFAHALADLFGREFKLHAKRAEYVGRARARGEGAVTVLGDGHARACNDEGGASGDIVGARPPLANVRLHHGDALRVLERVPDGALSFVYLLHPDPWPKARHAKRRMVNDGPVELFAGKLRPGGEFRFGTDHPVYLRHALMVMRRHTESFEWLVEGPRSWQVRPGGWPETRYERKARTVYGHEVWYFRYRRR
jgi:hypothetical protein